jgi:hypothetical protein
VIDELLASMDDVDVEGVSDLDLEDTSEPKTVDMMIIERGNPRQSLGSLESFGQCCSVVRQRDVFYVPCGGLV